MVVMGSCFVFFFKQKTAYEMLRSLVGSEMCIRDSVRDTVPMRRLHWLVEHRLGRAVTRTVLRTRVARKWKTMPESPLEVVGRIAPTPLLIIHGDTGPYFSTEHPLALAAAAGHPSELWLVPGFGHAENAAPTELLDRLGRHLPELLARGPAAAAAAGR